MSGEYVNVYRLHDHAQHAAELRAELESAKARLCSHGVLPLNCNEPHEEADDGEA